MQKAGREQTAEQAAAQQRGKEALAWKEAGRAKATATRSARLSRPSTLQRQRKRPQRPKK